MFSKILLTDIVWDTDEKDVVLPERVVVHLSEGKEVDPMQMKKKVEDHISNLVGFCLVSFEITFLFE